jgi:alkanesulfonate monooxygenase SsuD/methylene tetrahydromethanopterin reductase-like flavin-dependent oxidoreductase (luciferase family)
MTNLLEAPPLGIMNQMWAAPDVSDEAAIATALEEIRVADDLGFSSVWIGEHHGNRPGLPFYGRVPAPEVMVAYIAASTRRIKVGSGVRILSSTTPERTAEEMSLLHVLTRGRVEYGVGLGSNQPNITGPREERAERFRSALDDVLALLGGRPLIGEVALTPKPSPEIRGKLWAAARDAPTLRFLAERGVNLVVGQVELGIKQAAYVELYRACGGTGATRGVRLVFVAETHAEAMAESEEAARNYFMVMGGKGYHKEAVEQGLLPPTVDSPEELRRQVDFLAGDPEELNVYLATTKVDRLDVMVQIPGLRTESVRRSMRLIQEEVRPRLRFAGRGEGGAIRGIMEKSGRPADVSSRLPTP